MDPNRLVLFTVAAAIGSGAATAHATPAFARKYRTSCVTCHTIFPKLTPFGEAFRRNGFRFPGIDSDYVKAEPVALGTDATKQLFPDQGWPGVLSAFPSFAIGFNGTAVIHPDTGSSAAVADHGTAFSTSDLVGETHLWAMGSYDDSLTYFSEVTFTNGGISLERGAVYFNDLLGPKHFLNVSVGKQPASLTSFGPHSSYLADTALPQVSVSTLYGATGDQFLFTDNHTGVEVSGVVGGRVDYAFGLVAGATVSLRNTANIYGHAGVKWGGMTLDGEDSNADHDHAKHGSTEDHDQEHSVTLDGFAYRSISTFTDPAMTTTKDVAQLLGASARGQWGPYELDVGTYYQRDDQVYAMSPSITTVAQWDEASWLVYPWLALAVRADFLRVSPDGGGAVSDVKITPGAAVLVRPNLRFLVTMPIERASGAPATDWTGANLFAAPATPTATVGPEVEAILVGLATAF